MVAHLCTTCPIGTAMTTSGFREARGTQMQICRYERTMTCASVRTTQISRGYHYQLKPEYQMAVASVPGALNNKARAAVVRQVALSKSKGRIKVWRTTIYGEQCHARNQPFRLGICHPSNCSGS